MFVGRSRELKAIRKELGRDSGSAILVYGRRRIGKTTLISEALKGSTAHVIRFTAVPDDLSENARRLSRAAGDAMGIPGLEITSFESVLKYIASTKEGLVLEVDEYQDLRRKKGEVVDAYFRDFSMSVSVFSCGYFHGRDYVFPSVSPRSAYRELAPREYDRLGKAFRHETQGRCRVCHGVGPVQYHEAVISVIFVTDEPGEGLPCGRFYICGIYDRVEGAVVYPVREFTQFGDLFQNLGEVERFQRLLRRVYLHSDGSAGIDEQNG